MLRLENAGLNSFSFQLRRLPIQTVLLIPLLRIASTLTAQN